jgi:hypothetical protein
MALTQVPLSMLDQNAGGLSLRNKLINGNFDFWQRGTANGSTDSNGFLADRWKRITTGSSISQSQQAFTLGQTAVPGEPAYYWQGVVTSSAGAGNLALFNQPIESVRTLAGQSAVLTFWAKADASKNMAVELSQSFGTGGSPSSAVTGISVTTCALTTSWQKFTLPVSVPSISGKTLGSSGDDSLSASFWFDAGSTYNSRTNSLGQQSGTFSIARVQLEQGTAASNFEDRPKQTELALCQRYFQYHPSMFQCGQAYGLGSDGFTVNYAYPVTMRIAPTATIANGNDGGSAAQLVISPVTNTKCTFQVRNNGGGGLSKLYTWDSFFNAEL